MSKVKILIDDPSPFNRFKKGDIGEVIKNDSTKYDYFLRIYKTSKYNSQVCVNIYFYKDEVEIIK